MSARTRIAITNGDRELTVRLSHHTVEEEGPSIKVPRYGDPVDDVEALDSAYVRS